ncbi:sn-glycerol-3-phosphate ABC transporter ATP-binding protein UgpC [Roseomonas gilardii subsp. gilardii]|uniref:ABC transporter ATP-binding protein n=1 Tax=Roseomonas gilardii TaxID=257708 RepID=UPI001FFBC54A|nr:sn-glycerol-3-phosphate ABC transporter ATP-binding protein UgpC [Roseomonas gilardii]UPG70909.1 sn-glycerol-3-phosphate ABC transporter ATP-binding protein UgpC [Roseomonas gilardii subsp. gilardii]
MATLTLRDIRKSYADVEAIKGIDLDVLDREFVVFVGPSGCGKSTLLRMIAGLEEITSGDLLIDGRRVNDLGPADRGLAMVFQSYALYPHMTVRDNMGFALKMAGTPKAERDRKVGEAARILQLEPYLDRRPKALSGGQRQRVAIGRAIVRNPKIFLFDEPLSNLDAALRGQMRIELARLHEELKATMIYVTHDQIEAMTMADKIVVLQAGRVEQVGSPLELYHHPRNLFVAGFIGSPRMNMLPARVTGAEGGGVTVQLEFGPQISVPVQAGTVRPGEAVTVGIRPEGLRPDPAGPLQGEVLLAERLGGLTLLHLRLSPDQVAIVQLDGGDATRPHEVLRLSVDPRLCHVFDERGAALPHLETHHLAA